MRTEMGNSIDRSISELREIDELSAGDSPIHRLCPEGKLLVTAVYIFLVVSFGKYDLSGLLFMVFYPVLLFQISGISFRTCLRKLRFVLPLVCAVGLFNPFFDRTAAFYMGNIRITGGMISMLTLMLKGLFCLTASFLLIATTRIEAICRALRRIHIPAMLVTLLLLTYRYVTVMTEEVSVMTQAYSLRAPGQKGIHVSAWGSFLGQLLLRSMDRAAELYSSMLLRGYHGSFYYVDTGKCGLRDAVYAAGWCGFFVLARLINLTRLAGSIFL